MPEPTGVYARLERLLQALGPAKKLPDGSWMVRCPGHDDHEPSLHITVRGNKILMYCFAGCTFEHLLRILRERGLWEPETDRLAVAFYVYEDEQGRPLFRKIRFEPKDFLIERNENGRWIPGLADTRRVIYRLPEVLKASEVWIVEGEKDVESLRKFGVVATTNPNGASEKIRPEYVEPLKGKSVIIIPDNDEQGQAHAADWIAAIRFSVAKLRLVRLPERYKDVSEFLAYHDFDELLKLVAASSDIAGAGTGISRHFEYGALEYHVPEANANFLIWTFSSNSDRFMCEFSVLRDGQELWGGREDFSSFRRRMDLTYALENRFPCGLWTFVIEDSYIQLKSILAADSSQQDEDQASWLVRPFLIGYGPNVLYGPMGNLKSLLAQAIGLSVVTGKPFLPNIELSNSGPVIWLDYENMGKHILYTRAKKIAGQIPESFRVISLNRPLKEVVPQIGKLCKQVRPVLIIIDSLGPAAGGDLSAPAQAFKFYEIVTALRVPTLIVAHPPKNNPGTVFGSAFFSNLARSIWAVEKVEERPPWITIALFHEKSSASFLEAPIGYRVRFDDNSGKIEFYSWSDTTAMRTFRLGPYPERIIAYLQAAGGSATRAEIAEACGLSQGTLRIVLSRMAAKRQVKLLKGEVRLLEGEEEEGEEDIPF